MKPETLEARLIDRALGELTPEAAELVEEYLALHPEAARRGAETSALLDGARRAVAVPSELPARTPAPRQSRRVGWRRTFVPDLLKLAACVAVGLAAGWWAHVAQVSQATESATDSLAKASGPAVVRLADAGETEPDFWSVAYLLARQRERPGARPVRTDGDRIPWETIVK
jgi:anti-sigma factor RsiW